MALVRAGPRSPIEASWPWDPHWACAPGRALDPRLTVLLAPLCVLAHTRKGLVCALGRPDINPRRRHIPSLQGTGEGRGWGRGDELTPGGQAIENVDPPPPLPLSLIHTISPIHSFKLISVKHLSALLGTGKIPE